MAKKDKKEEIPSWIKDLYKEDLDRVVRGERPMYFRGMDDSPLKNVSPEFDILSGGAAVKGMNGIRGALSPLNNGVGNYNFSIRGINKKIGELVDEAGLYLPEKLRPVYRTVVDAMSSSKDKGLDHITQPLANALYPADERRNRRLDGEHPVGYVDAIDGIWPREKYGLWGEKIEEKQDGGEIDKDKLITLIKSSDANFARRLRDEKRKTIPDWEVDGNVATHKLGYAGVDGRYVIYPSVREIDGELYDFTDPKNNRGEWDALESAIADGDTIMVDSEREAEWLTGNYKNYFKSFDEYAEGGPVEDIARKMYRSDLDRVISGQSPQYYGQLNDRPLEDVHPEFDVLTGGVPMRLSPSYKMGLVGKDVFTNPWESSIYGKVFDKLDDYASIPNEIFTKYLGKTLRGIRRRIPDEEDKERFESAAKKVADNIHRDLDYYIGLISTTLADDEKDKKEDGGPVDTDKGYGEGKYVVDPGRSDNNKMVVYDEIWDYLTEKKGIPQTQAVGILANIAAESGGDTEALGAAGDFGIQQWLGPRKKELQRRYGKKPTLTQQLDYLVDEYQGRVPGLGWNYMNQGKFFDKDAQGNVYNYYMYSKDDFDNATNYKDATVAWNQGYGRPLGSTLRNEKRFEFADMFSNRYGVPENEPMRYEFGQRDSGTGDGGQQPVPETVAPADPSLASRPTMDSWWEKEGQDLLYKMLAQSGANKKAIEDIANNIKNDPQSEAQIAEAERIRREQAKRQLVLDMIPGLMLNIKGMSSIKSGGGLVDDNRWFYDEARRKQVVDKQNTMRSLSEEKHKILKSSRLALEQGFIDEDQFRRINNLPVFKLSDDVKSDGGNNKEAELINSLFDTAMYDSFGKSVKEQSVEEEKNRKERFYPYKLMADSLLTIGDIATASPGFLRLIERSGARLYPLLNNIAHSNSIQKISGLSGIGVDSSQIALDPDDDNLWNILGVAGAAAELIGGMDILRNTSVMGRIGNRLDDILDIANPVVTLGGLANDILD